MKTNKTVNWRHLNEYARIFGLVKLRGLWREYLTQAAETWSSLPGKSLEERRLAFHSWKSSSQIFGLDEFAGQCAVIEEHILCHQHLDKLDAMIEQSRQCYHNSIKEIAPYFDKQEDEDET